MCKFPRNGKRAQTNMNCEKKRSRQHAIHRIYLYIYILYTNWMEHLCSHFSIMSMDKKRNLSSASITAKISHRNNCPSHMPLCPNHTQADCRMIHLVFLIRLGFCSFGHFCLRSSFLSLLRSFNVSHQAFCIQAINKYMPSIFSACVF